MIFNIQKCSIHDGEGLRTLVFFKGCALRCKWCANPESQEYAPEIIESPTKCIGCGYCFKACPKNAIRSDGTIDRDLCDNCMKCTDICYAEAKRVAGKDYTTEELYKEIEKDKPFYEIYGGGVTFSGGEPLTHGKELRDIARMCKEKGIGTMVESCGFANYDGFKDALPYIDGMFMDIKHIDSEKHRELTGQGNELILENIRKICEGGMPVTIRTPVVPGYNDEVENIRAIAEFVGTLPTVKEYELLAYHNLGESKYRSLGRAYELHDVKIPSNEHMRELVKAANGVLEKYNKECFWTKENNREVIK